MKAQILIDWIQEQLKKNPERDQIEISSERDKIEISLDDVTLAMTSGKDDHWMYDDNDRDTISIDDGELNANFEKCGNCEKELSRDEERNVLLAPGLVEKAFCDECYDRLKDDPNYQD